MTKRQINLSEAELSLISDGLRLLHSELNRSMDLLSEYVSPTQRKKVFDFRYKVFLLRTNLFNRFCGRPEEK